MEVRHYSKEEHDIMANRRMDLFGVPEEKRFILRLHNFGGVNFQMLSPPESIAGARDWETREDDIFISTFTKSGTHWMYEIVLLILANGYSERVDRSQMMSSVFEMLNLPDLKRPSYELLDEKPSPRVIITHLPWQLLPKQLTEQQKGKIVYVMRNPKDVVASHCRFLLSSSGKGKDEELWKYLMNTFLTGESLRGSWFDHVEKFWEHRNQGNVFFTSYEQMKKDLRSVVEPMTRFLGHELDEEALGRIEEKSTVKAMKKSYDSIEKNTPDGVTKVKAMGTNSYIQKGVTGSWKDFFTVAENELFDQVCKEKMANWDVDVVFE